MTWRQCPSKWHEKDSPFQQEDTRNCSKFHINGNMVPSTWLWIPEFQQRISCKNHHGLYILENLRQRWHAPGFRVGYDRVTGTMEWKTTALTMTEHSFKKYLVLVLIMWVLGLCLGTWMPLPWKTFEDVWSLYMWSLNNPYMWLWATLTGNECIKSKIQRLPGKPT